MIETVPDGAVFLISGPRVHTSGIIFGFSLFPAPLPVHGKI